MEATKSVLRISILALTFSLLFTTVTSFAVAEGPSFAAPPPPLVAAEPVVSEARPPVPTNNPGDTVEVQSNTVSPQFAVDENQETHQWIAYQGYRYFSAHFEGADIADYLGVWDNARGDLRNAFLEGTFAEDQGSRPPLNQWCPFLLAPDCPYWRHFVAGADGSEIYVGYDGIWSSALTQAEAIFPYATAAYPGNKGYAFYCLGHVAHILGDMNLPTHVHNDGHPGDDAFEVFMSPRGNFQLWSYGAGRSGNWTQQLTLFSDLYSILYRTANYAEGYDSKDVDGDGPSHYTPPDFTTEWHHPENVDRSNGFDGTEVLAIADDLVPHAIKRTAELIRLFYFAADMTQPACAMTFPSSMDFNNPDVRTSMTSFNVTANASDHESGVEKAGYRFSWSYWTGSGWASWVDLPLSTKAVSFTPPHNNTTYAFSVQAWNGAGKTATAPITYVAVNYSSVSVPTVVTNSASSITTTSAVLNATITSDGGASITERRFEYGSTPNFVGWTYTNQVTVSGSTFSYGVSGLTANTAYYFRAWAKNSAGWSYGVVQSFTTAAPPGVVSMPTFSPAPGTYTSPQQVTMSTTTTGATVRYTTNGAEPTDTSTAYSVPINVSTTTNFKAKAFKAGMTASQTASASYTITVAPATYQIAGALTLDGSAFNQPVELRVSPDVAGEPYYASNGQYSVTVPASWSGRITPVLAGYDFVPGHRDYTSVSEDYLTGENYTVSQPSVNPQLTMNIVPQGAVDAGAKWSVEWYLDGHIRGWLTDWYDSGSTIYLTYEGYEYHVIFTDAQGYITPQDIIFTAQANQTYTFQGNYAQLVGSVHVMIEPQAAVTAGAQWRLAGGAWRASGAIESSVPIGNPVVQFSTVPGYFAPLDRSVTVNSSQVSTFTQAYQPQSATGPTITSVTPNGGPKIGGTSVTIRGTRFLAPVGVTFGGVSAVSTTLISDMEIRAVAPASSVVASVTMGVTTAEGQTNMPSAFTYLASSAENIEFVNQIGGAAFAVTVQGNYAYMGEGPNLVILNISSPSSPARVSRVPVGGLVQGITVSGTRAYVSASDAGVYIVDISSPSAPSVLSAFDTPGTALGSKELGGRLYIADYGGGLRILNVSNPGQPQEISSIATAGSAKGVHVSAGANGVFAYVAVAGSGLQIIDVTNPALPQSRSIYDTPGDATNVCVVGTLAYVADNMGGGLRIIDISNPDNPTYRGGSGNGWPSDVKVVGSKAYVVGPGLTVLDISNPASPTELGWASSVDPYPYQIAISGSYAYIAHGEWGMTVYNVGTPSAISLVGHADNDSKAPKIGNAECLALAGGLVYVGTYQLGLRVIDPLNSTSPRRGEYPTGYYPEILSNPVDGRLIRRRFS